MEMSFANHESAYGTSGLAKSKYNFFGVGAEDEAFGNAYTFVSPEACILNHTKYHMSRFYFDAYAYIDSSLGSSYYDVEDKSSGYIENYAGDPTYFGTNPGNKNAGVNVRYASDPFHGEKVAGHMYAIDKYLGMKDYGRYSIGMTNKITYAYREADISSWKLYKYSCKDRNRKAGTLSSDPVGMMVTIIGEEGDFYKILSDMPVNKDGYACYTWEYDENYSVAYVLKSDIDLVYDAGNMSLLPRLASLIVEGYDIGFDKNTLSYTLTVENDIETLDISAVAEDKNDAVKIGEYVLEEGRISAIEITVTDEEGHCNVYTLNVIRSYPEEGESSIDLSSLSASYGSFTKAFRQQTREYTLEVADLSKDISFEYIPVSPYSAVEVIGGKNEGTYRLYTIIVTSHEGDAGYYRVKVVESN